MHADDSILRRSLLEPFKIGVVLIDGFGERVSGHISYDGRQKLTLSLITVRDAADRASKGVYMPRHVERAVGVLETGEYAMLEDVVVNNQAISGERHVVNASSYSIRAMLVGKDVLYTRAFGGIAVGFKGLSEWLDQKPGKTEHRNSGRLCFEHQNPQIPEVLLGDGTTLRLFFSYSYTPTMTPPEDFHLSQSAAIDIRTAAPAPLDSLYSAALRFNRLIMLIVSRRMPLTFAHFGTADSEFALFGEYEPYDTTDVMDYFDLGLYYAGIGGHFSSMVNEWFAYCERYDKSLDLYFDTWTQHDRLDPDILFLRVVRSLEALHRKDHTRKRALKARLEDLLEIPYEILEPGTDKEQFAQSVQDIRDYRSHGFIEDLEQRMPERQELKRITLKLELLMHGNMVYKLSIPSDLKAKIMEKKIQYLR